MPIGASCSARFVVEQRVDELRVQALDADDVTVSEVAIIREVAAKRLRELEVLAEQVDLGAGRRSRPVDGRPSGRW